MTISQVGRKKRVDIGYKKGKKKYDLKTSK